MGLFSKVINGISECEAVAVIVNETRRKSWSRLPLNRLALTLFGKVIKAAAVLLSRPNRTRLALARPAQSPSTRSPLRREAAWRGEREWTEHWDFRCLPEPASRRIRGAKVTLNRALCLLVMAAQNSVFTECDDNHGWLSDKSSHYFESVCQSSHFACQQPIYLEMCGRGNKRKQMPCSKIQMHTNGSLNQHGISQGAKSTTHLMLESNK